MYIVYSIYPYPATIFSVLKILSDFYVCCINQVHYRLDLIMEANTMNPDPKEQSDMGPSHLQWRCLITLSRREEQTQVMTCRKMVKFILLLYMPNNNIFSNSLSQSWSTIFSYVGTGLPVLKQY